MSRKNLTSSSPQFMRRSSEPKAVFGINPTHLDQQFISHNVPTFLLECGAIISKNLDEEGLFRVSGDYKVVYELEKLTDLNVKVKYSDYDVHIITTLVGDYFRKLPDALFPSANFVSWVALGRLADHLMFADEDVEVVTRKITTSPFPPEKTQKLKEFLSKLLPEMNRVPERTLEIMRWLFKLLSKIVTHSKQNKMTLMNVGTIFGASLLRQENRKSTIDVDSLNNTQYQSALIEAMIVLRQLIFVGTISTNKALPHSRNALKKSNSSVQNNTLRSHSHLRSSQEIKGDSLARTKSASTIEGPLRSSGKSENNERTHSNTISPSLLPTSREPRTKMRSNSLRPVRMSSNPPMPILQSQVLMKFEEILIFNSNNNSSSSSGESSHRLSSPLAQGVPLNIDD